jgi:hypothetical protein
MTVTTTLAVVKTLAAGAQYSFTIDATNNSGNTGPASTPVAIETWSPPNAVSNLTVVGEDGQLKISWTAAAVPKGSPAVSGYKVSVAGSTLSTTSTSITHSVPAWTNESVTVYAVNSVGNGKGSTASGTAWARTTPHLCHDVLSGDVAVLNSCAEPGGAWVDQGGSSIRWISSQPARSPLPAGTDRYVCVTYYSGGVSGTRYALATTPTDAACTALLPGYQSPDTPHPIAYVSSTSIDGSSQHVCEYEGHTTGQNGTFTSYELSPCGTTPPGMSGASSKFSFWT